MNKNNKIKKRNRIAHKLLDKEIELSCLYEEKLSRPILNMSSYEISYKARVVKAVEKLREVLDKEKIAFLELAYFSNNTREEVCELMNISESTYYEWRNKIVEDFAIVFASVPI